jgi:predicted nucleic acid-binding protein
LICPDASVVTKWLFAEEHSEQARALYRAAARAGEVIVAPSLLASEITNNVRQRLRRGELDLAAARGHLARFLAIPIELETRSALYDRALVLAHDYGLAAAYDAQYVATAELAGATFWTADQRLIRALRGDVPFVRWIGDYESQGGG